MSIPHSILLCLYFIGLLCSNSAGFVLVARVSRPGPFAITRSGLQSFDLGLDGGLALASRIAQVFVVGFRLIGPLFGSADLGVDRLDRLLEDDRCRFDRIDRSLGGAAARRLVAARARVGVVGAADRVDLLSVLGRQLLEGIRLLRPRSNQGFDALVHLLSLGHGSSFGWMAVRWT